MKCKYCGQPCRTSHFCGGKRKFITEAELRSQSDLNVSSTGLTIFVTDTTSSDSLSSSSDFSGGGGDFSGGGSSGDF